VGVASVQTPFDGQFQQGGAGIRAQALLDGAVVAPGGTLGGTLTVDNGTGRPARLRLLLDDIPPGAQLSVTPALVDLPASGTTRIDYQIRFETGTPLGANRVRLRVVDDANPALTYASPLVSYVVQVPPPWWERWWPVEVALAALLLAAVALLLVRARRRRSAADMRGVILQLYRGDRLLGYLPAPDRRSEQFPFLIRDEHGAQPRLDHASGPGGYVARRGAGESLLVSGPLPNELRLHPGRPVELPSGLALAFPGDSDGRRRSDVIREPRRRRRAPQVVPNDSANGSRPAPSRPSSPVLGPPPDDLL
jgi:hypothetical protein